MWKNEMALRNILGFFPTYMRPPYSSCTAESGCESDLGDLGYHITYFDVDTDDYDQDSTTLIQNSKNWFTGNITARGATAAGSDWLVIGHDIHYQTAYNLTDYMLSTLTTLGYKAVTLGECLGDPSTNWYRAAGGAATSTNPSATSSTVSKTFSSVRSSSTSFKPSSTSKRQLFPSNRRPLLQSKRRLLPLSKSRHLLIPHSSPPPSPCPRPRPLSPPLPSPLMLHVVARAASRA